MEQFARLFVVLRCDADPLRAAKIVLRAGDKRDGAHCNAAGGGTRGGPARRKARFARPSVPARAGRDRAARRPSLGGRSDRPVDGGCEPDQMAPRARHLVLRAVSAGAALPGYTIFDERFPFLFNSYYVAAGPRHARPQRGLITRPNGEDVTAYRAHVDAAVERLIETVPAGECATRLLNSRDRPASRAAASGIAAHRHPARLRAEPDRSGLRCGLANAAPPRARAALCRVPAGIHAIGHEGDGFCFDNETPRT